MIRKILTKIKKFFLAIWRRIVNFFKWIWKQLKRFWRWVVGLLVGTALAASLTGGPPVEPPNVQLYKDYKFSMINRNDDGYITWVVINFYEGEYKDVDVIDPETRETKKEDRYVRTKKLQQEELQSLNQEVIERINGTYSVRYTIEDFGKIKTDDELREFLDVELEKLKPERKSIEVQKVKENNKYKIK